MNPEQPLFTPTNTEVPEIQKMTTNKMVIGAGIAVVVMAVFAGAVLAFNNSRANNQADSQTTTSTTTTVADATEECSVGMAEAILTVDIPSDWDCEVSYDGNDEFRIGMLEATGDDYKLEFNNGGIGDTCGAPGSGCVSEEWLTVGNAKLSLNTDETVGSYVLGIIEVAGMDDINIFFEYPGTKSSTEYSPEPTEEDKQVVKEILETLVYAVE